MDGTAASSADLPASPPGRQIEDDPIAQAMPQRPTFIPLQLDDLRQALETRFDLAADERLQFRDLCQQLRAVFHVEQQKWQVQLEADYQRLDPDSQQVTLDEPGRQQRIELSESLVDRISDILRSAHYKRLSHDELQRAIDVGWQWGVKLDVDVSQFARLEIFARGYQVVQVSRRRWQNFFRRESIELPEFSRLILAFRIQPPDPSRPKTSSAVSQLLDPRFVYLKSFKNIPETDLEILLPGSRVRLTKLDRAKILLPTLSGLALTAYKIARGALILSLAFTWDRALGWAVLIGATVGYLFKSVLSYFRTRTNYQFGLTKSLYLKNLDNNLGVIYRVLNEAEEQELLETVLAYGLLYGEQGASGGLTSPDLDQRVEAFLQQTTGRDVDFEVDDALAKLQRLGLAEPDSENRWVPLALNRTGQRVEAHWQRLLDAWTPGAHNPSPPDQDRANE